jgi:hypothetical protein
VVAFVAGTKMGLALGDHARKLGIGINRDFEDLGKGRRFVARTAKEVPCVELDELPQDALTLTVLSPTKKELEAFEKEWDEYLKKQAAKKAGGAAAAGEDRSPTNLSSIILLAEAEGRRILLTGDAKAAQILDGLRAAGRLTEGKPYVVDLLKVGHHGSRANASLELFQQVHARHYVISANGKHGNPDRETLDWLWEARGKGDWQLWTTFPRNAFELVDPDAGKTKTERKALEERRKALEEIQAWLDDHPVKVHYRDRDELGIQIHLGDEKLI